MSARIFKLGLLLLKRMRDKQREQNQAYEAFRVTCERIALEEAFRRSREDYFH